MERITSLINFLRKKRLLNLSLIILLLVAIPLSLYLIRNPQILRSRATGPSTIEFPGVSNGTTTSQTVALKLTYNQGGSGYSGYGNPSPTATPVSSAPPSAVPLPQPLPCTSNNCVTGLVLLFNDSNHNSQLDPGELGPAGANVNISLARITGGFSADFLSMYIRTDDQGRFILHPQITDPANSTLRLQVSAVNLRAIGGSFSQAGNTKDTATPIQQLPDFVRGQYPADSFLVYSYYVPGQSGYIWSPEFQATSPVIVNVVFAGSGTGGVRPAVTSTPTRYPTPAAGVYNCTTVGSPTDCTLCVSGQKTCTLTTGSPNCTHVTVPTSCTVPAPAATATPRPTATPIPCLSSGSSCNLNNSSACCSRSCTGLAGSAKCT